MTSKSLTKNSAYYLIYNILNVIFPFITGIYVARVLLQGDIGKIESAKNLAQYFVILSFLGLPTYGIREISKVRDNKKELNKIYSELIALNTISTGFFSILYYVLIASIPYYRENFVLYAVAGISIILNFLNNTWLFDGLEEFKYTSIRNVIFKAVSFVLLIILVKSQDDYLWYLIISVVGTAGNYLLNILHSKRFAKISFRGINLKRHLKPVLYLVVVNLAIEIYSLVDVTMLGLLSGDNNVAIYSYGMKIYKILIQVVNTFTMVLVPRISFYYEKGMIDEFNTLITKTLKIILLISIPMVIGVFFVSDYLITAIYGEEYSQSAQVLKILSLILIISPIGYLLGSRILLVTGQEKKMIIPVVSGAIVNVIGNLVLIHFYNEIGAAIASVIGEVAVMIIYIMLGHKFFKLHKMRDTLIKEGVAISLMTCLLIGLSFLPCSELIKTIIQIPSSILIYFGVLIICKEQIVYACFGKMTKRLLRKKEIHD